MTLNEFWKSRLKTLKGHVEKNPNDIVARDALNSYITNRYLKRYLVDWSK